MRSYLPIIAGATLLAGACAERVTFPDIRAPRIYEDKIVIPSIPQPFGDIELQKEREEKLAFRV